MNLSRLPCQGKIWEESVMMRLIFLWHDSFLSTQTMLNSAVSRHISIHYQRNIKTDRVQAKSMNRVSSL